MGHVDEFRSLIEPLVREVPNFPTAGVLFRDLTRLFANARGCRLFAGKRDKRLFVWSCTSEVVGR